MTLRTLTVGSNALIESVDSERLIAMGFRPGARVTVLRKKKGCLHVRVNSTEWAIRESTAEFVKIVGTNYG